MCSRYCSLTGPLWFSMIMLLMLLSQKEHQAANVAAANRVAGGTSPAKDARIARYLLLGVIAFLAFSSGFAIRSAKEDSGNRANGRRFVLALKTNPAPESEHNELFVLYPTPRLAAARTAILIQNHLSAFRE